MENLNANQAHAVYLPCAECGESFAPSITKTKICTLCIKKKNDITEGIPKSLNLAWCKYCRRWCGPPWTLCERESKELLAICLKHINGLKKLRLIDAKFLWTEPHSRRTKLAVTVQKDISKDLTLQQTFEAEFYEVYTQCDDCKKLFTPHQWKASVQVRQKVDNKKTFMLLEQMMLKSNVHRKAIKISAEKFGMDFFFSSRNHAQKLVDFLNAAVPHKNKESKELVSHDSNNNTYNFKYTLFFEMPRICKDDLVVLPKPLCKELGGVNAVAVCYKVGSLIHLYDPVTLKRFFIGAHQYFNYEPEIAIIPFKKNETEFFVSDIYTEDGKTPDQSFADIQNRFARCEVSRSSDGEVFCCTTYLGHILNHGDLVLGFDLKALNREELVDIPHQKYLPDVVLIRKTYPPKFKKKRIWKIKKMEVEEGLELKKPKKNQEDNTGDMDAFLEELEQDKYLRSKVNLYVNEEGLAQRKKEGEDPDAGDEMVKLEELMRDLDIQEEKPTLEDFTQQLDNIDFTKKDNSN